MTGQFPAEFARRGVVDGFGKRNEVITTYFGGKGVDKGTRERTAGNGVAGSIHHNRCPGLAVRKPLSGLLESGIRPISLRSTGVLKHAYVLPFLDRNKYSFKTSRCNYTPGQN